MSDQSFTTAFSVDQTPQEAFDAITNVRGWWSEAIEGGTEKPDDEFTYRYQDVHHCKIRVVDAVPARRVTWLVLDNYFNFTEDNTEWNGTTINFEISEQDGKTAINFTHQGLVPEHECFDSCRDGWTFYINTSLRSLITTGKGRPNSLDGVDGRERSDIRASS
ncbi:MAG TPA: SRPBCC domain-containing protein [Streptosporangiaceae bacterium]|nr:SRPBCC domain-containing protein [Streptosporangiaceae bacterium]